MGPLEPRQSHHVLSPTLGSKVWDGFRPEVARLKISVLFIDLDFIEGIGDGANSRRRRMLLAHDTFSRARYCVTIHVAS